MNLNIEHKKIIPEIINCQEEVRDKEYPQKKRYKPLAGKNKYLSVAGVPNLPRVGNWRGGATSNELKPKVASSLQLDPRGQHRLRQH